ncbi:MAG: hypothetical protein AAGC46_11995 [Solirubrobacteraceae bacterium]|nr:hypothetical protein [Patulibacter sp.]
MSDLPFDPNGSTPRPASVSEALRASARQAAAPIRSSVAPPGFQTPAASTAPPGFLPTAASTAPPGGRPAPGSLSGCADPAAEAARILATPTPRHGTTTGERIGSVLMSRWGGRHFSLGEVVAMDAAEALFGHVGRGAGGVVSEVLDTLAGGSGWIRP